MVTGMDGRSFQMAGGNRLPLLMIPDRTTAALLREAPTAA